GTVLSAPFSIATRRVTHPVDLLDEGVKSYAISQTGVLALYHDLPRQTHLAIVDRAGAEQRLPGDAASFDAPRASPDGRHAVVAIDGVWVIDLVTSGRSRVSSNGGRPEWESNGSRVVYHITGDGWAPRPWDLSGPEAALLSTTASQLSIGPPHSYLAVR